MPRVQRSDERECYLVAPPPVHAEAGRYCPLSWAAVAVAILRRSVTSCVFLDMSAFASEASGTPPPPAFCACRRSCMTYSLPECPPAGPGLSGTCGCSLWALGRLDEIGVSRHCSGSLPSSLSCFGPGILTAQRVWVLSVDSSFLSDDSAPGKAAKQDRMFIS